VGVDARVVDGSKERFLRVDADARARAIGRIAIRSVGERATLRPSRVIFVRTDRARGRARRDGWLNE